MPYTADDIRRLVKEQNVRFLRLQLTDILGVVKNIDLPITQLDKALEGEMMFDGSSIEGFVRIEESDMFLRPDPSTFAIFPWKGTGEGRTARLICDVYTADGEPFDGCPRCTLKKVLREAEEMGFSLNVGSEPEFFLFLLDEHGKPTVNTHDSAGYFDLAPIDHGEDAREEMVLALQEMGFEIEASHHEVAPGQHEIDFKYAPALETADNIATFRFVVRTIANRRGLHATFMPKPVHGINGSGMHLHQSLFNKEGKNVFYDPNTPDQLSDIAYQYIAGILHHAPALTAILNPLVNSYKRLVPGYEAPVYVAWSHQNRSPMIRVPARRGVGTRAELRSPDPSCNPYLALAVCLKAGLDGIKNKMVPPMNVEQNIYEMSPYEREEAGIPSLPGNLLDAIRAFSQDEVVLDALGQHIASRFIEAKTIEWGIYREQIHQWEIEQYLGTF